METEAVVDVDEDEDDFNSVVRDAVVSFNIVVADNNESDDKTSN